MMVHLVLLALQQNPTPPQWPVHSMDRPRPPVVQPGPEGLPAAAPGDAIVLFDGSNLAQWRAEDGQAARWMARNGYVEVAPGSGSLVSARPFGDIQLHIEWATPTPPKGEGQERGNSGVFVMGMYEVQVLDSYQNDTYPDGQAGALFGQQPPLVNVCRPPGAWQSYDIVFRRPRFGPDGALQRPARVTVFQNGAIVQDAVEFTGRTVFGRRATYSPHADRLPLSLQDHSYPVRFRNIWVRELTEP